MNGNGLRVSLVVALSGGLLALGACITSKAPLPPDVPGKACDQSARDNIDGAYAQYSSTLGAPIDDLYHWVARDGGGCYRRYSGGLVFSSPTWGAHEIHGSILGHYLKLGFDAMGYPSTDEKDDPFNPGGRYSEFDGNARIYWSKFTGAWTIKGAILEKWQGHQGDASVRPFVRDLVGYPTSDENDGPGGSKCSSFVKGTICWHPTSGAHEVHGSIHERYMARGGPNGYLGYPTSDETTEGNSQFSAFSGGWIYWTGSAGAQDTPFRVHGGRTYTGLEPAWDPATKWNDVQFWNNLRDWTAASPTTYLYRRNAVKNAFVEKELGLCWPQTDGRYCTGGGTECWGAWCSELAHYILLMNYGGVQNISAPGPHNDLGDAYTVGGFESVFEDNSTHPHLWVPHDKINEWTIEPGDYLAVLNGDHSTIVVGVKWDKTQVWTVERVHMPSLNYDCVSARPWPYKLADGTINPEFYGVGKLHCDIVDQSACVVQKIWLTGTTALGSDMQPGEVLHPGQSLSSANGAYTFAYQADGNLVLYRKSDGKPLWASKTEGNPAGGLLMQTNGDLVIYDTVLNPIWMSGTWQHPGSRLMVQDDGNVVVYRPDNAPVWATNTAQ